MARFSVLRGRYFAATLASAAWLVGLGCASNRPSQSTSAPQQPAAVEQKSVTADAKAADAKPQAAPVAATPGTAMAPKATTFNVRHALTVKDIPADAKQARVWFWLPDDDDCQKALDFTVA